MISLASAEDAAGSCDTAFRTGSSVELPEECVEASVTLSEHYGRLLRQEHDQRLLSEEHLQEVRASLHHEEQQFQVMEDEYARERAKLLQVITEKDQVLSFKKTALVSELAQERAATRVEHDRLLQRLRQQKLCQRKLSREVASLSLERDELQRGAEVCVPTPQRRNVRLMANPRGTELQRATDAFSEEISDVQRTSRAAEIATAISLSDYMAEDPNAVGDVLSGDSERCELSAYVRHMQAYARRIHVN